MTDDVLKELWNIKDNIAKEHGYNIDGLAEYYLKKQASRHGRFHREMSRNKAEQGAPPDGNSAALHCNR